jgi:tetratricopeptide (TPR) repeat protein
MVGLFSRPKNRIKKLVKEGDYKEALELGKSLEKKNPHDHDILFILGSIYYILEDAKNSLHYFDKVLEISEYDSEALLLKANVHLYLKENKPVINCCNKILEVDPNNEQAKKILEHLEKT